MLKKAVSLFALLTLFTHLSCSSGGGRAGPAPEVGDHVTEAKTLAGTSANATLSLIALSLQSVVTNAFQAFEGEPLTYNGPLTSTVADLQGTADPAVAGDVSADVSYTVGTGPNGGFLVNISKNNFSNAGIVMAANNSFEIAGSVVGSEVEINSLLSSPVEGELLGSMEVLPQAEDGPQILDIAFSSSRFSFGTLVVGLKDTQGSYVTTGEADLNTTGASLTCAKGAATGTIRCDIKGLSGAVRYFLTPPADIKVVTEHNTTAGTFETYSCTNIGGVYQSTIGADGGETFVVEPAISCTCTDCG